MKLALFAAAAVATVSAQTCERTLDGSSYFQEFPTRYTCGNNNDCNLLAPVIGATECQANGLCLAVDGNGNALPDVSRTWSTVSGSAVVQAGGKRNFRFAVDDSLQTVGVSGKVTFVMYGGEPQATSVKLVEFPVDGIAPVDLVVPTDAACAHPENCDYTGSFPPMYWTMTLDVPAYTGDDEYAGQYKFQVTNNYNFEPMVVQDAYLEVVTRFD